MLADSQLLIYVADAVSPSIIYLWLFSTNDVHCCFQELKKPIAKMISRAAFLIGSVLKTGCLEICLRAAPAQSNHLTQSWPFNPAPLIHFLLLNTIYHLNLLLNFCRMLCYHKHVILKLNTSFKWAQKANFMIVFYWLWLGKLLVKTWTLLL